MSCNLLPILTMLPFLVSQAAAHQRGLMKRQASSSAMMTASLPLQIHTKFPVPVISSSPYPAQTSAPASSSSSDNTTAIALIVVLVVVLLLLAASGLFFWKRRKRRQARVAASRNVVLLERKDSSFSTRKFDLMTEPETAVVKN